MNQPQHPAVAKALLADVVTRMPTLTEITSAPLSASPTDMGPDVTLPAVHMHILAQHIENLDNQVLIMGIDLTIAERTAIGLAPNDDGDARTLYAARLGELLVKAFNSDHDSAVATLLHAAAAILCTKYDGRFAARAFEKGAAIFADGLRNDFVPKGALQ
ncbi:hypothetical protein VH567_15720 [Sphingomonas sp. 4RDLI-65]|uniref:hypothetical protein n=1 Tax=Sphingomonas sp. 4RDLI-65 TaxID=3111641 RepID=UPI003C1F773F